MSVPNESYSRNMHWVNTSSGGLLVPDGIIHPVVSTLGQYLFCWTISPRWHHPPSSQYIDTDMVYWIYLCFKHNVNLPQAQQILDDFYPPV